MNGYIKLYRKFNEWEWYQDNNTKSLFLHILLKANHQENKWRGINIKKGQLITGRYILAKETGISLQSIRTSLNRLKSTSEITIKSTNKYSIITLLNWEKYQSSSQQSTSNLTSNLTNNQPATNQQLTTNKNDKNEKNNQEDILYSGETSSPQQRSNLLLNYFHDKYLELSGNRPVMTSWGKHNKNAQRYIKQYGLEKMKELVNAYFDSADQFFAKNNYSINIFLTDNTIQKLWN